MDIFSFLCYNVKNLGGNMRYNCDELDLCFEMNDDRFVALSRNEKIRLFHMNDFQLRQNLALFAEVKNEKYTGRYFQISVDMGRFPTTEAVKKGQDLCIKNVKKFFPNFEILAEDELPDNIRKCVWQKPDGKIMSQYYISKNGFMLCVAGDVTSEFDELDTLMENVSMSFKIKKEQQQKKESKNVMEKVRAEAEKLVKQGLSVDEAITQACKNLNVTIK